MTGAAEANPATILFAVFRDTHLGVVPVRIACAVIVSHPFKTNPETIQAPPAVVMVLPIRVPFLYNITSTSVATLSGEGIVPEILEVALVIGVADITGVAVVVVRPTHSHTGSDSHCPGRV